MSPGDSVRFLGPLERREQPFVGRVGILVRMADLSWNKRYVPQPNDVPLWIVEIDGKGYPLFEDEMELVQSSTE
jgi:hypothetical protein